MARYRIRKNPASNCWDVQHRHWLFGWEGYAHVWPSHANRPNTLEEAIKMAQERIAEVKVTAEWEQ